MTVADTRPPVLHVVVHARPDQGVAHERITLFGKSVESCRVVADALDRPFPVTFEAAAERVSTLPRMFFEPDGSFVWVSSQGPADWQVDGQLNDSAVGLMTVELKISGPPTTLDPLLQSLGWPGQALLFQLVRQGVFLDEPTFRQL